MSRRGWGLILAGLVVGAGLLFFLNPKQERRRRAMGKVLEMAHRFRKGREKEVPHLNGAR